MSKLDSARATLRSGLQWGLAHQCLLAGVALPLVLRTIPEVLAGPWPLGFDTVWVYAPFVKDVETEGLGSTLTSTFSVNHPAPLVFVLLGLGAVATAAPPFAITKAAGPVLYGFLGLSLYYFGRRGLQWDQRKSFFLVLVTTLYFVPLRFSWDMYKNLLGYAFFLLAFAHFRNPRDLRETTFLLTFAGLSILSSELTAALFAAIAGALLVLGLVRERRWNLPTVAVLVAAGLGTLFYLGVVFPATPLHSPLAPPPARSLLPYNYVGAAEDVYVYPTLVDVYAAVLFLSGLVLGPLIPFAVVGFARERRMVLWTGVLAIGSFSILVWPYAAIPAWHRWLFMLALPALVFATHGVSKLNRRLRAAFLAGLLVLAASFVALPPSHAFPLFTNSKTASYLPTSMLQNTVPLSDSSDVVAALEWLNGRCLNDSALLAPLAFAGWAKLYSTIPEVYEYVDRSQVDGGDFSAFSRVYLIYWASGRGWFNSDLFPGRAVEAHRLGNIAVYELPI